MAATEAAAPRRFVVDDVLAGRRLGQAMASLLGVTRSQAVKEIDAGGVTVNGRTVPRSTTVAAGDEIVLTPTVAAPTPPPPVPPIVWEDEHLLVVDKPAGLVVHPGFGRPDGTLVDALRHAGVPLADAGDPERPGIVHRLDLGTTGLLVVAKTTAAHETLSAALQVHDVDRRYLALVSGRLATAGRIEVPLGRDQHVRTRFVGDADGRDAVTHWRVLSEVAHAQMHIAVVTCRLETGRTHQIRAHLRCAGAPVVGDHLYDGPTKIGTHAAARPLLHAARLAFAHPVTGERIEVTAEPPADIVAAANACGLPVPTAADVT